MLREILLVALLVSTSLLSACAAKPAAGPFQQVIVLNRDPKNNPRDFRNILARDIASHNTAFDGIKAFCESELTLGGERIRQDAPAPTNVYGFNAIRIAYPDEIEALDEKQRAELFRFYRHLEQINAYLTARSELTYTALSNFAARIKVLDQLILAEMAAARALDFGWTKQP